jgi:hypothetical protein
MKVRVLYEDQLTPNCEVANYAPHTLVLKCLYDQDSIVQKFPEFYLLGKTVSAVPCKGNSNVIKHLKTNARAYVNARIAPACCLDSDRVHELFELPKTACKSEIKAKHWQDQSFAHRAFVLLERNLEDVMRQAQKLGANFPSARFDAACGKNLDARDALLLQTANNPNLRKALVANMASFKYLIDSVARLALLP